MAENTKRLTSTCPECGSTLHLSKAPTLGRIVHCQQCDTPLEVVNLHPLVLEMPDLLEEQAEAWVDNRRRRHAVKERRRFAEADEWRFYSRR